MLFSAAATDSPIQFGAYLLTECVGQGGMAVVYKATRHGPNGFTKTVVVKAMLPALTGQREFVAMFSGEARLMAQLAHPNIVQVHDFGVVDGIPYLAMEYLPGRNLSQLRAAVAARGQRMPIGCVLAIARDVCHGLGYAHDFVDSDGKRRQIIHRDVSPSNVMVCRDGSVKLLDFGVAKIVGEFDYDVTQSFKGKFAYMSPEQVTHQPIDRRVDVFAAGIVIHELLTGKRLFAAPSELETLQRVSAAQVVAPSVDNPEVPRALDAVVKKALARDPRQRYASGAQLAEALEALDALTWSRRRLAAYVADLFANDFMVICDVCGKQVLPGDNCSECGTAAPHTDAPLAVDPDAEARARSARQALRPLLDASVHTDRNEVPTDGALPALPPVDSGPLPLPPPPLVSRKPGRPKLEVVHTPLPPPVAPRVPVVAEADDRTEETPLPPSPVDVPPAERAAAGEIATGQHVEPVESATMPPPGPPRLFVVPQPELTPLPPPSPFSTPRPAGPQPLFVVPPTPSYPTVNLTQTPRLVWYTSAAAAIGLVALGIALAVSHPSPREPMPAAAPVAATVQTPVATPLTTVPATTAPVTTASPTRAAIAVKAPAIAARPTPSPVAPSLTIAPVVHAPARRHVRPHPAPSLASSSSSPSEPERTVKEGRIVDPFAGLK
jgi:serine/threonine protein kinase, bacterial